MSIMAGSHLNFLMRFVKHELSKFRFCVVNLVWLWLKLDARGKLLEFDRWIPSISYHRPNCITFVLHGWSNPLCSTSLEWLYLLVIATVVQERVWSVESANGLVLRAPACKRVVWRRTLTTVNNIDKRDKLWVPDQAKWLLWLLLNAFAGLEPHLPCIGTMIWHVRVIVITVLISVAIVTVDFLDYLKTTSI